VKRRSIGVHDADRDAGLRHRLAQHQVAESWADPRGDQQPRGNRQ